MINIAVVGGRDFNDYTLLKSKLDILLPTIAKHHNSGVQLVSGGAKGADSLAERYAAETKIPIVVLKPDWSKGQYAGLSRNTDIVNASQYVIAFPGPKSTGTYDTISKAKKKGLTVVVF